MNIFKLTLLLSILFSSETIAQNKNLKRDSILLVSYNETLKLPDFTHTKIQNLLICGNISYWFFTNPDYDGENYKPNAGLIKNKDSSYTLCHGPMFPKYPPLTYWTDSLFPMKWNLISRTKDINGHQCYEASTYFRGRYYTAFYDPNIPISDGPVKFGGLPGLIIKIYDSSKMWDYELKSITKVPNDYVPNKITIAGNYEKFKIIYKDWDKRIRERQRAKLKLDPNCITCGNPDMKTYSLEIN